MKKAIVLTMLISLIIAAINYIYTDINTYKTIESKIYNVTQLDQVTIDESKEGVTLFLYDLVGIESFKVEVMENNHGKQKTVLVETYDLSIEDRERVENLKEMFKQLKEVASNE